MAANNLNNSIIVSSGSDRESDSGSTTDYEPEPKKCKVENTSEEGNAKLQGTNTLIEIPIRAATTLLEFSNQRNGVENGNNSATGVPQEDVLLNNNIVEQEEDCSVLTVGNIVQQTLEVSLRSDSPPRAIVLTLSDPRTASETNSDSYNNTPRVSTSAGFYGSLATPNAIAGDFPTIAREVVIRTGSGARSRALTSSVGRRSQRHRVRSRNVTSTRGGNATSQENNNDNSSRGPSSLSSFSSVSSSEYFTDDIDPMEIPSDEYVSPPYPTRQRRNAIFMRREPPPSALDQNEDDQYYHNELEVASVLDINENPIEDGSSTSGVDDEVLRRSHSPLESLVLPPEETDNNFADNENVKSDGDSEPTEQATNSTVTGGQNASQSNTPEKDKWLCSQCQAEKTSPCYRYCLRCFKIRRTWLPPRPASRRLKTKKALLRTSNPSSLNNSITSRTTVSSETSEGEDVVDGHHAGSQNVSTSSTPVDTLSGGSLEVHQSLPCTQQIDMNNGFVIDDNNPSTNRLSSDSQPGNLTLLGLFAMPETSSEIRRRSETTVAGDGGSQSQSGSSSSQSQQSSFSLNSQISCATLASTQSSSSLSQPTRPSSPFLNRPNDIVPALSSQCSICYVRDKDAAFVHNKIAHLYCCYTCADKILKKNGKCPICRERVLRVVKIIGV